MHRHAHSRRSALTLVEVAIALAVFTGMAFLVSVTLSTSVAGSGTAWRRSVGLNAVRDVVATMQDAANTDLPQVYDDFNGTTVAVPELTGGQIVITCYRNEGSTAGGASTRIPTELGGDRDLNMDGDDDDDCIGADLKLVPTRLVLTWTEGRSGSTNLPERVIVYALIGSTVSLN